MSFDPAPVILFVHRRPSHTRKTLRALAANAGAKDSELIIFSDGPRDPGEREKVSQVRKICAELTGFARVERIDREENLGLAASILQGVGEDLQRKGKVIVLEDDLLTHPSFLTYMNGALDAYQDHPEILSVSSYLPPRWRMPRSKKHRQHVWLYPRNLSYGWGTWSEKWDTVDWTQAAKDNFPERPDLQSGFAKGGADLPGMLTAQMEGRLDSWSVRFSYAHYRSDRFSLLPVESYVKPIGFDGSGVNCRLNPTRWLESTRRAVKNPEFPPQPEIDQDLTRSLRRSFDRHHRLAEWLRIS
ncbi:MAG: glycosyltransferase [Kiritimatiellia bacterium]